MFANFNIIPKGFQPLAGGKLAPPPENAKKSMISRRDKSDPLCYHPFGMNEFWATFSGGCRAKVPNLRKPSERKF